MAMKVSIVGGSGYAGGELLRILLGHPEVEVQQVTSESLAGKFVTVMHPNLRKHTTLKFCSMADLKPCDALFIALPHGKVAPIISELMPLAPYIFDLSADFRLKDAADYPVWYGYKHPHPELLRTFVYGVPELYRDKIKNAKYVAGTGCLATVCILALAPLFRYGLVEDEVVIEGKFGSSAGGSRATPASHHPNRSQAVRAYAPTGHRHTVEIIQELNFGRKPLVYLSATSVDMVRGISAICHVFLKDDLSDKEIWQAYRADYGKEPFIRIVSERYGIYRYPEPKILAGTNYCDIGFERDPHSRRLVVMAAIDNLVKGAAGGAVQSFNVACGFPETTGLEFTGLHP
jgi:N-acetyl-gamma-glutamyl-phosphate/LysW-gamma-L-alpha-aminoadipyl-6-phosphate reductase